MKNPIILIVIYIIVGTNLFAQNEFDSKKQNGSSCRYNINEKISYEFRIGVNFIKTHELERYWVQKYFADQRLYKKKYAISDLPSPNDKEVAGGIYNGFQLGVLANLPLLENVDFQTGVFMGYDNSSLDRIINNVFIGHPFFVSYHKKLQPNIKWNVKAGTSIIFLEKFSLVAGTGLYFNKFFVGIQSDWGLTNSLLKGNQKDYIARSQGFGQNYYEQAIAIQKIKFYTFSIEFGYKFQTQK